jgi:serine/threonine protein kinase
MRVHMCTGAIDDAIARVFAGTAAARANRVVELDRQLGREVWLAHHPMHGRVVYKRATTHEVRITALAGVTRVFESGADYVVMERVTGEPLDVRLRREGQLRVRDALAIARTLARTLVQLHARGIAHRDIKPENIVGDTLIDFGSASVFDDHARPSATLAYMAPEQARADAVIDARADLYAFGGVMFAMLVGRAPFGRRRSFATAPPRLRDVLAGASPALDALVARCLAHAPDDRFASAAELVDALDRIADHDATPLVAPMLPPATTTLSASALAFEARSERRASAVLVGLVATAATVLSIVTGHRIAAQTAQTALVASMSDVAPEAAAQPIQPPAQLSLVGACYR